VGLLSSNRAEWVIAEQACNAYSFVSVPLYDTLGPDAVSYVVNQTEMTTIVVSEAKLAVVRDAHVMPGRKRPLRDRSSASLSHPPLGCALALSWPHT